MYRNMQNLEWHITGVKLDFDSKTVEITRCQFKFVVGVGYILTQTEPKLNIYKISSRILKVDEHGFGEAYDNPRYLKIIYYADYQCWTKHVTSHHAFWMLLPPGNLRRYRLRAGAKCMIFPAAWSEWTDSPMIGAGLPAIVDKVHLQVSRSSGLNAQVKIDMSIEQAVMRDPDLANCVYDVDGERGIFIEVPDAALVPRW